MFDFGDGNYLTIKDGIGKAINFNSVLKSYMTEGSFDKDKKAVLLQSATKNFSAKKYSNLASIDGSQAESASITGNNKANIIIAGKYGSTIAGGKGKDSIYASSGADVFVYDKGDGKDTIYNYGEGDKISLGSNATIKDAKIKKDSAVFKIGSGSITVDSLTSGISFNDTIFSNGIFISETAKVLGSFSGTINLGALGVSTADASLAKKKITINGSSNADSLVGGKGRDTLLGNDGEDTLEGGKGNDILIGGAGKDSLWGGKGNDTLTGGAGDDIFIFRAGDGSDTITDYSSGDMLTILNKKGTGFADYKKTTFSDDTLTLAINGGGKVVFKNISGATAFNINGKILTR